MDFIAILLCIFVVHLSLRDTLAYKTYDGYKIYDIWATNDEQAANLQEFYLNNADSLDFLSAPRTLGKPMRLLTSPEQEYQISKFLSKYQLNFEIVNNNVTQSIVDEQDGQNKQQKIRLQRNERVRNAINFESYQRLADINKYMDYLAVQYPKRVKVETIGQSYEGLELKTILITSESEEDESARIGEIGDKQLILLDAGMHAREWIAPAVALYAIQQLVENSTYHHEQLQNFDWLIWPIVNPDGYEYSHSDRMWRKTRKPSGTATKCVGTDPNRNFDFYWGFDGASSNACAENYKGPKAFSEPETIAMHKLFFSVNHKCRMYLTLHSYGNFLLYPWGYDAILPPNWKYMHAVAQAGADAIKTATGTIYQVGSSTNMLYAAAGGSDDYALGVANIPVSITMELPSGGSGFDPPVNKIAPIVAESWLGIKAMATKINDLGEFNSDFDYGHNAAKSLSKNIFWKHLF